MISLSLYLAVVCLLNACASGFAVDCNNEQIEIDGICCDICPPGTYVKEYCSQGQATVCSPCEEGLFSEGKSIFKNCEKCDTCQHDYVRKCTPTTNAKCSCRPGFLCSNPICSKCEEEITCKNGKLKRTGVREYSYICEACPDNTYFDTNTGNCRPLTQCSTNGLVTLFPGNKTHNSVCGIHGMQNAGDSIQIVVAVGFLFISFALFAFLFYACMKKCKRHRTVVSLNTSEFHLSKEETGNQPVLHDGPKDKASVVLLEQLHAV